MKSNGKLKIWGEWRWKHNTPKLMEYSESSSMREVSRNKCLLKERRKILNKQPNFTPHGARKSRQRKTQSS